MQKGIVLCARVSLVRNCEGLPFDLSAKQEMAESVITRTVHALKAEGIRGLSLLRLRDMGENDRQVLLESGVITAEMCAAPEQAAILRNASGTVIQLNGADHLRIQVTRQGADLLGALRACFQLEDALTRQVAFASDARLGYLTSSLQEVGTGLRASLVMHLPMLTVSKRQGQIAQEAAKAGLELRGVFGGGSDDLSALYELRNRATLGCEEQELVSRVAEMGARLCAMEQEMREKAMKEGRIALEDIVGRAWGTLLHARLMSQKEFYQHWSNLRLGAMLKLVGVKVPQVDVLLPQAQTAHLRAYAGRDMTPPQLDASRASRVRELIYQP